MAKSKSSSGQTPATLRLPIAVQLYTLRSLPLQSRHRIHAGRHSRRSHIVVQYLTLELNISRSTRQRRRISQRSEQFVRGVVVQVALQPDPASRLFALNPVR